VDEVDHPIKKAIRREMDKKQTTACRGLISWNIIKFFMKKLEFHFMGIYGINKADI
jgi:hypothetical protein